jgi:hypothetical protein
MWQIQESNRMDHKMNQLTSCQVKLAATTVLTLVMAGGVTGHMAAYEFRQTAKEEHRSMTTGSKFFCNIKALAPAERAHHKQLTEKLISSRTEIVETEKGYEFQFNPSVVSIAELADWVVAESKCCPFFDFHIDLEREGTLVCLRLTGDQGIKHFIQSEFQLPAKQ